MAGPLSPPWRMSASEVSFSLPLGLTSPWHPTHLSTRRGRTSFSKKSAVASGGTATWPVDSKERMSKRARTGINDSPDFKASLVFKVYRGECRNDCWRDRNQLHCHPPTEEPSLQCTPG